MMFNCEQCGKLERACLSGRDFGEEGLCDLRFWVTANDDGTFEVVPEKDLPPVIDWSGYWKGMAEEVASNWDVFTCPKCGGYAVPDDMLDEKL